MTLFKDWFYEFALFASLVGLSGCGSGGCGKGGASYDPAFTCPEGESFAAPQCHPVHLSYSDGICILAAAADGSCPAGYQKLDRVCQGDWVAGPWCVHPAQLK